jgi:hypothetical protein
MDIGGNAGFSGGILGPARAVDCVRAIGNELRETSAVVIATEIPNRTCLEANASEAILWEWKGPGAQNANHAIRKFFRCRCCLL